MENPILEVLPIVCANPQLTNGLISFLFPKVTKLISTTFLRRSLTRAHFMPAMCICLMLAWTRSCFLRCARRPFGYCYCGWYMYISCALLSMWIANSKAKQMQSPPEQKKYYESKKLSLSLSHTRTRLHYIQIHRENRHKNIYLVQPPDRANGRSANHEFPNEWHRQHDTQKTHYRHTHCDSQAKKNNKLKKGDEHHNNSSNRGSHDGWGERASENREKIRINEKNMYQFFLRSAENQNVCTYLNWYDHYDNIRWLFLLDSLCMRSACVYILFFLLCVFTLTRIISQPHSRFSWEWNFLLGHEMGSRQRDQQRKNVKQIKNVQNKNQNNNNNNSSEASGRKTVEEHVNAMGSITDLMFC